MIGRRPTNAGRLPPIDPVPAGVIRPTWSVMIPCHDDADLLAAALRSVLVQDPGADQMQIEVVDDRSTIGDPAQVARELGGGRVEVFRSERNLGAPAAFTTCVRRARGRWVHILHADDAVEPGFYDTYGAVLDRLDPVMAVGRSWFVDAAGDRLGLSGDLPVDGQGRLPDPIRVLAEQHPVNFAAVVVARRAYEQVGGFDPELVHANDWEMWTRVAAIGEVAVVPGALACYRRHDGSDTSRLRRSFGYVADPAEARRLIVARLDDPAVRRTVRRRTGALLGGEALRVGADQLAAGELRLAAGSATWAARLDPSSATVRTAAGLAARAAKRRLGAGLGRRRR